MSSNIPIIIIDDGVNNDIYNIGRLKVDIEISEELEIKENRDDNKNFNYHGATCAAIIRKYLPYADIGSIKILNNNKGTPYQLISAIKWCAENKVRIINLSLGTVNFKDFKLLYRCMKYAEKKGLIIIAAYNNEMIYTCPASFDNVIGVKCDITNALKDYEYRYNEFSLDGVDIVANSRHELVDNEGRIYTTPSCNSYATPVVTALVYELVQRYPNINVNEVRTYLKDKSVNKGIDLGINKQGIKENIDIPLMYFYDFAGQSHTSILKDFCELFRKDGYYAIGISDSMFKSSKHEGLISIKDYYSNIEMVSDNVIREIYSTFNCDILMYCMNEINSHKVLAQNSSYIKDSKVDIEILIVKKFTVEIENLIHRNSEAYILNISGEEDIFNFKDKGYKVFYDICQLYLYILEVLS